jgi:LDH2 family malate/lactate/ureidoglycolate dehydrogenase
VPTEGDPILADFATSVIPEGAVRLALDRNSELPEGAALDSDGRPTRDPARFYGPPIGGLLPLGGAVGYKGYALGLLAEVLAGALSGSSATDATRSVNGIWLLVIDPNAFLPIDAFRALTSDYVTYLKSSTPVVASSPVLVPGEREFVALKETDMISVDEGSWRRIIATASELGVIAPLSADPPT